MFIRHSVMEWVTYSSPQEASGWSDDFFPKGNDESNIRILSSLECKTEIVYLIVLSGINVCWIYLSNHTRYFHFISNIPRGWWKTVESENAYCLITYTLLQLDMSQCYSGILQRAWTVDSDKPFQLSLHHLLAVTLAKLLNLIKAQFPHLYNGGNNAYFLG